MLEHNITEKRKDRHKHTQEDFTPKCIIDIMLNNLNDKTLFTNFDKTFCDPSIGVGYIYIEILKKRLLNCKTKNDIYKSITSMYGTELMEDNVLECKNNIVNVLKEFEKMKNINLDFEKINNILNNNIICTDAFKWDYENWKSK